MKKFFPLAILGAAVGAAAYFFNRTNKQHVEKTIEALDDIGNTAEEAVAELASEISDKLDPS